MKKLQKGIVLITTMLLLSFIIMIASLLIVTGKNTLLLGSTFNEREKAQYAAECGLAYVQYCIARNPNWIAEGSTSNSIYNPGFTDSFIVEGIVSVGSSARCVHGKFMKDNAEFYIAFWDGGTFSSSTSIRKDKASGGSTLKYYSMNNLLGSADSSSWYYTGTTSRMFKTVPKGFAHIIVEGRCNTARKYSEAMLTLRDSVTGLSCSMAAGDVSVDLTDDTSTFLVNAVGSQDCKIRSMKNIKVNSVTGDKNPYQIANTGTSYTGTGTGTAHTIINSTQVTTSNQSTYGITFNDTDSQKPYVEKAKIKWSTAAGEYVSGSTYTSKVPTQITGGTYIYRNSPSDLNTYKLYYYPTALTSSNSESFVNDLQAAEEIEFSTASGLISGTAANLTIKDNVTSSDFDQAGHYLFTASTPIGVNAGASTSDFCTAVYDYTNGGYYPSTSHRSSFNLDGNGSSLLTGGAATSGNIYIDGELSGTGSVLSAGRLTFQGHSALQADNNNGGLTLYACGTVQVDPVRGDNSTVTTTVNDALSKAWSNYTSNATVDFDSGTKKYAELRDYLLEKQISGTFGGKTYSNQRLIDVLTDTGGLNYDTATANNLVDTLLAKNTYLGDNNTSGSTGLTTHSFSYSTQTINGSLKAMCLSYDTTCGDDGNTITLGKINTPNDDLKISFAGISSAESAYGTMDVATFYSYHASACNGGNNVGTASWIPKGSGIDSSFTIDGITVTGDKAGYVDYTYKGQTYRISINQSNWAEGKTGLASGYGDNIMMYPASGDDYCELVFNDTTLNGLIYTWENVYGPDLQGGSFTVRGGVIAYGADPSSSNTPGYSGQGNITMKNARAVTFTYDPDYMALLLSCAGCSTKRVFQANF